MSNLAKNVIPMHKRNESQVLTGSVISVGLDEIVVDMAGEIKKAKKAFSCLIDPVPEDIILCTENIDGVVYILGIMERPGAQDMGLSFPSNTQIRVDQGTLNINSPESVTIASGNLNFFSNKAIHQSREAIVSYETVTAVGNEFQASFKTIRLISNFIHTMAKQVIDKFKGYVRHTQDHDMVKAGQISRDTDGLYSVGSRHTIMKSKKTTLIDAEKILMG
ncbi:MAG: DUF3540 domain-containing protein [Desulfobacula sp.]